VAFLVAQVRLALLEALLGGVHLEEVGVRLLLALDHVLGLSIEGHALAVFGEVAVGLRVHGGVVEVPSRGGVGELSWIFELFIIP